MDGTTDKKKTFIQWDRNHGVRTLDSCMFPFPKKVYLDSGHLVHTPFQHFTRIQAWKTVKLNSAVFNTY